MDGFAVKDGDKITQNGVTYTIDGDQGDVSAAAGINVLDSSGTKLKVTITEGAVYTTPEGKSKTLVGKNGVAFEGADAGVTAAAATWAAGDTIVDESGVEYTYVDVTKNKYLSGVPHDASGFYKTVGSDIYDTAYVPKAGDIYTKKETGETDSIQNTEDAKSTGIVTVEALQKVIKAQADGVTIKIHKNSNDATGKEYTVGPSTPAVGASPSDMTADDIAALIKEGQWIEVDGANYYTIPTAATSSKDISLNRAYDMMAEEIKKASDIGADAGMQSTVKNNHDGTFEITHGKVEIDSPLAFNLHVGADADLTNKVTIDIRTITTKGLGLQGLNVKDKTGNGATYALDAVTDALRIVSTQRSLLGAAQNRLDHTINNLDNIIENTTAAEANIRDTDMAEEMVSYANTQVLMQAGQSILAQANQANQGVLSLLQ
ncbi:MAG: flagellin [Lachnospiraceae bacterium]|nr:flagellin [Lachnospiraceae bacterium]